MLESVFKQKRGLARHQEAPLLSEREQYLAHLLQQGTSLCRVRIVAGMLLNVVKHLKLRSLSEMELSEIHSASKCWVAEGGIHRRANAEGASVSFNAIATNWFRFHSALTIHSVPPPPFGEVLPEFVRFLAGPRAMTPASVRGYTSRASLFLRWAIIRRGSFSEIKLRDIDDYLASLRVGGMKPRSIVSVCQTLRTLFRFTEKQGWNASQISAGISSPSVPRYDPEPKGPRWCDVRRMLSVRSTASGVVDLRANAVLFLFAIYGLRSVEVASLMLSDFDWQEGTFSVRRAKSGRLQRFPIQYEVGEAVIQYLRNARPTCACRNLFLTLRPPFRPMSHASLRYIVASRLKRLGIKSAQYSTHALRHSCATELLHRGISMHEIADFLGHRNTKSVVIYAKCSAAALRNVAKFRLPAFR